MAEMPRAGRFTITAGRLSFRIPCSPATQGTGVRAERAETEIRGSAGAMVAMVEMAVPGREPQSSHAADQSRFTRAHSARTLPQARSPGLPAPGPVLSLLTARPAKQGMGWAPPYL